MNSSKFRDILNNFIGFKCVKMYIDTWKFDLNVFTRTQFGVSKASIISN